ncbi:MAG TPA: AAA family ATPase, partial [Membranihabitans sp.]|nr:AAA family ATPase [Membranihabitans sp.]
MAGSISLLRLDDQFNATLDELENTTDHYFITGRAGTGKSTLLRLWRRSSRKKVIVLAPTGSAALQVDGQTIHSFFGFPPRMMHPDELKPMRQRKLVKSLEAIIIDEISMVRADMIDQIDVILRLTRGVDLPFGGIQMVFFGDLFQLPPIVSSEVERIYLNENYDSPYFFSAHVWKQDITLVGIELTKIYRQEELDFLRLLEEIRYDNTDQDTLDAINTRYHPSGAI